MRPLPIAYVSPTTRSVCASIAADVLALTIAQQNALASVLAANVPCHAAVRQRPTGLAAYVTVTAHGREPIEYKIDCQGRTHFR